MGWRVQAMAIMAAVVIGPAGLVGAEHTLSFECKGRNPAALACWLGVDALAIDQITPYAVPAEKKAEKK